MNDWPRLSTAPILVAVFLNSVLGDPKDIKVKTMADIEFLCFLYLIDKTISKVMRRTINATSHHGFILYHPTSLLNIILAIAIQVCKRRWIPHRSGGGDVTRHHCHTKQLYSVDI